MGLRLIGTFDEPESGAGGPSDGGIEAISGGIDELVALARAGRIDVVYITLPLEQQTRITALIEAFSDTTTSVYVVPDLFLFDLFHGRWVRVGSVPAISVFETPFYGVDGWLKRLEDVVVATGVVAIMALLMALIAFGIKPVRCCSSSAATVSTALSSGCGSSAPCRSGRTAPKSPRPSAPTRG